ncbi:MAG TPA: flagellar cap protein FliD N-terminal domain-containing protein, partial [Castellaniella sp.]|nr:flagellar cap protein FliD N-terminal domain-containing protein [Castellaniella sp.]
MPTIQSLGMSGLPLDSLLTSLQNNENLALQAIQSRQTAAQAKLSAYGKLQAAVSA